MNKNEIDLYRRALENWGTEAQIGMLHEEMAELIVAINKWRRAILPVGLVLEEIVDLEIMLDQLRFIIADAVPNMSVEDLISLEASVRNHKLDRLAARLGVGGLHGGPINAERKLDGLRERLGMK